MERGKSSPPPGAFGGGVGETKEESPAQQSTPASTPTPRPCTPPAGIPGTAQPHCTPLFPPLVARSVWALASEGRGATPGVPSTHGGWGCPVKDGPTAAVTDTHAGTRPAETPAAAGAAREPQPQPRGATCGPDRAGCGPGRPWPPWRVCLSLRLPASSTPRVP